MFTIINHHIFTHKKTSIFFGDIILMESPRSQGLGLMARYVSHQPTKKGIFHLQQIWPWNGDVTPIPNSWDIRHQSQALSQPQIDIPSTIIYLLLKWMIILRKPSLGKPIPIPGPPLRCALLQWPAPWENSPLSGFRGSTYCVCWNSMHSH